MGFLNGTDVEIGNEVYKKCNQKSFFISENKKKIPSAQLCCLPSLSSVLLGLSVTTLYMWWSV